MAANLQDSIRAAAAQVAEYVKNVSEMRVETCFVDVDAEGMIDFAQARPAAQTVIQLDGDSKTVLPVRRTADGGLEVDAVLLDLHQQNVTNATEYRTRMVNALLGVLRARGG